ncbi:hypothetical protein M409DRAFT_23040 [Zasmidium cellare ATCC 36951]|uniref:Cupin 2 conserved barrel domain-containing protein n=1 Tax=Zasmidium cellare ATCC 36951 TaxID=1080233 RepID=A0A6A6CH81_ZASCE|nr:uncharacterized protein M409DRAFT_23040 [Zasmidium cellare ATCC 36951]KAF2166401.1 hypothetical protein M409DRAFT_23040 [Zasmidium cellare ATCC 36951]
MSQARETDSIPMGKVPEPITLHKEAPQTKPPTQGCKLIFKTSPTHHWTEVTYDGAPTSWVPSIPPHWHKHHDEWMQVLSGRVDFTLSGTTTTLTPTSPPLHIPRLHAQFLVRAGGGDGVEGADGAGGGV